MAKPSNLPALPCQQGENWWF